MQHKNPRAGSELGFGIKQFPVTVRPNGFTYTLYLKSILESPEEYIDALSCLSGAGENDLFEIYLNSAGGSLSALDTILFGIQRSEAHIKVIASGTVASAATFFMFHCDEFEVSANTQFLFHSASFWSGGKSQDAYEYTAFQHEACSKLMRETYKHFFTEEELDDIIKNKREWWMDAEEFSERFLGRNEHLVDENEDDIMFEEFMPPSKDILNKVTKKDLIRYLSGEVTIDKETGEVKEVEYE